jgi:hypothetical protein
VTMSLSSSLPAPAARQQHGSRKSTLRIVQRYIQPCYNVAVIVTSGTCSAAAGSQPWCEPLSNMIWLPGTHPPPYSQCSPFDEDSTTHPRSDHHCSQSGCPTYQGTALHSLAAALSQLYRSTLTNL